MTLNEYVALLCMDKAARIIYYKKRTNTKANSSTRKGFWKVIRCFLRLGKHPSLESNRLIDFRAVKSYLFHEKCFR